MEYGSMRKIINLQNSVRLTHYSLKKLIFTNVILIFFFRLSQQHVPLFDY